MFGGSTPLISAASLKACNLNQYSNLPQKICGSFHPGMSKKDSRAHSSLFEHGSKSKIMVCNIIFGLVQKYLEGGLSIKF